MTASTVSMSISLDVTAREKLKAIAVRQKRTPLSACYRGYQPAHRAERA